MPSKSGNIVGKWLMTASNLNGSARTPKGYLDIRSNGQYVEYDNEDYLAGYWKKIDDKLEFNFDADLTESLYQVIIISIPYTATINQLDNTTLVIRAEIFGFVAINTYKRQ